METRKYRYWKVGNKEIYVLEGGKQGNVSVGRWKQTNIGVRGGKQGNIGVGRRKTRKSRCWKVGKQGNLGVGRWETRKYRCWKTRNIGVGRWETRKYRCWKVENTEIYVLESGNKEL